MLANFSLPKIKNEYYAKRFHYLYICKLFNIKRNEKVKEQLCWVLHIWGTFIRACNSAIFANFIVQQAPL